MGGRRYSGLCMCNYYIMGRGVNLGGTGGHVPPEFGVGTPMYNVPPDFGIFSVFFPYSERRRRFTHVLL